MQKFFTTVKVSRLAGAFGLKLSLLDQLAEDKVDHSIGNRIDEEACITLFSQALAVAWCRQGQGEGLLLLALCLRPE